MPTRLGMGQFGKARPQWKEIASGYAVIRPESVASVTEVCSFPKADFWTVSAFQISGVAHQSADAENPVVQRTALILKSIISVKQPALFGNPAPVRTAKQRVSKDAQSSLYNSIPFGES